MRGQLYCVVELGVYIECCAIRLIMHSRRCYSARCSQHCAGIYAVYVPLRHVVAVARRIDNITRAAIVRVVTDCS